jgi:tRNA threonylcarbamoyladenosine biosynthesis protein TsaE
VIVNSPEEMEAFGAEFVKKLPQGSIVAFQGDLGAGKTTFIRGMARGLGLEVSQVSSPTFVYLNIYGEKGKGEIYHFDLYRLKGEEDFILAGFEEYLETSAIVCLEWSERISSLLPKGTFLLKMHYHGDKETSRFIEVERL